MKQRDFKKWAMGYYNSKKQINDLVILNSFDPYSLSFEEVHNSLVKFPKGIV